MNHSHLSLVPPSKLYRTFAYRSQIPSENNCLWKIEHGIVRTSTLTSSGNVANLGFWGPGDVFGKPLSKADPYMIQCLKSVKISPLPSHLWHQELNAILLHAKQTEELLSILHNESIYVRLIQCLGWLVFRFSCEVVEGEMIAFKLTHQEIAETIGTTRVTVSRLMKKLERAGLINQNCSQVILLEHFNTFRMNAFL
jgi:CRP-like cAMP-binding protein